MNFVPAFALNGFDQLIEEYNQCPKQIMLTTGINPEVMIKPDGKIPGQQFNDLLEYAAKQLKQRYFGILLAKVQGPSVLGTLWFVLKNAMTLEAVIKILLENYSSHTETTHFSTTVSDEGVLIHYGLHPEITGKQTQIIELGLAVLCFSIRQYIDKDWSPAAVYLRGQEPYEKRLQSEAFGQNIYYEQEYDGILIQPHELGLRIKQASELQRLHYQAQLEKKKELSPLSTVVQVENFINASLTKYHCNLGFIAKQLGLKPRTLQHHLKIHGTNFNELKQKARLNLALQYLKDSSLSATEISQRLLFSDLPVFTRFVKKHTGSTPSQLRQVAHISSTMR